MTARAVAPDKAAPAARHAGSAESRWLPVLLLLPGLVVLLAVIGFPMLYSLYLSFTNYTLTTARSFHFVGIEKYITLAKDRPIHLPK